VWLCDLDKAKGLDTCETYKNDKSGKMFVSSIANVEHSKTTSLIQQSKFFSVTMDGATNVSGTEQQSIFLHWATKGVRKQRFLRFVSAQTTTSKHIYESLMSSLNESEIDIEKMVGTTFDGAANMAGNRNGVNALLKQDMLYLVTIHCLAHRVELAIKDVMKTEQSNLYDKTNTLLSGIYYLYKNSSKLKKELFSVFELLKLKVLLPARVGGTRWVPHTVNAINIFLKSYRAIVTHLDNASHNNAKAAGLSKMAHEINVLAYIFILKVCIFFI
jgi:hypothetical protein